MKLDIFKIGGRQCIENCSLTKVQSKTFDEITSMMVPEIYAGNYFTFERTCYFDGVQLIFMNFYGKYHILEFDV